MMMKLNDFYKAILNTGSMVVTDDNCISFQIGESKKPATVKGKRLVLPTPEHLASPNWQERVVFHPLQEHVFHSESEVLAEFRKSINIKLSLAFSTLAKEMLRIAADVDLQKGLTPDQLEYLSKVHGADTTMKEHLDSVFRAMPSGSASKSFVWIYLRRGALLGGKKYPRVAGVSFPLYEELVKAQKEGKKTIFGVTIRAKDRDAFIALLEYMVPEIDKPEHYSRGSNSAVAPFMDALMKSVIALAPVVNDLVELFRKPLGPVADSLMFNDTWVEVFDNLDAMLPEIRSVPMQAGNEGKPFSGADAAPPKADVPGIAHQPAPAQPLPVAAPQQQNFQPAPPPPPVPLAPPHNPYQPQQMQQHPPAIHHTNKGLDWESAMRANPALAAQAGAFTGYQPMMHQPVGNAAPRWAQPGYPTGAPPLQPPPGQYYPQPVQPYQPYPQPGYPQQQYQPYPQPGYPQPGYPQAGRVI